MSAHRTDEDEHAHNDDNDDPRGTSFGHTIGCRTRANTRAVFRLRLPRSPASVPDSSLSTQDQQQVDDEPR